MEKLDKSQKQLVLVKLRELKRNPDLLEKYDTNGDGVISEEEWEAARRDIIKQVLKKESSQFFEVAPILTKGARESTFLGWMYDNRESISAGSIILGGIMILIDPGTFAPRDEPPFDWGEGGFFNQLTLIQHWLNWTSSGWAGFVMLLFGGIWSRHARYFID